MTPLPPPSVLLIPVAALGMVMGSFVTALSYRTPRGESVAHGRSKCPACGHVLGAADLVPMLSWLVQGGACRYCRAPISWRYPAIEGTTTVLFVAAALVVHDVAHLVLLLAMTIVMVALSVVDLEQRRLPNGFLITLAVLSLAWRWFGDRALFPALVAAAAVFAIGVMLNAGFRMAAEQPGLGMGDTKLLALAGFALSPGPLLIFLGLAGALGFVFGLTWWWRSASRQFPFGPAILISYWVSLALGTQAFDALASHWGAI